ncbi:unnamed protein product [Candida parapsilosis]
MITTKHHSIFDLSDYDYDREDTTTMSSRTHDTYTSGYNDTPHDELISTLSSNSLNSLFDVESSFHSNRAYPETSTVTPALSRHENHSKRKQQRIQRNFMKTSQPNFSPSYWLATITVSRVNSNHHKLKLSCY